MIAWVLYDIRKDKVRAAIAKSCKLAGLYRVQYSVFLGTLTANERDELELRILDCMDEKTDSVYIFPMSKAELKETALLGLAFDKELITDQIRALFF